MDTTQKPLQKSPPERLRIRRLPERANYERDTINEIIDATLIAHVAAIRDGLPLVIPMFAARDGVQLLLHGAPAAGTMRRGRGQQVAVSLMLLDGLVLARSAFHHSLNYRSVVIVGEAHLIADEDERGRALDVFMQRLVPGRGEQLRPTNRTELKQTAVLRISLEHASAKIRTGPPGDDEEDYDWPVWAGVLPVTTRFGVPEPDPRLGAAVVVPDNIRALAGTDR